MNINILYFIIIIIAIIITIIIIIIATGSKSTKTNEILVSNKISYNNKISYKHIKYKDKKYTAIAHLTTHLIDHTIKLSEDAVKAYGLIPYVSTYNNYNIFIDAMKNIYGDPESEYNNVFLMDVDNTTMLLYCIFVNPLLNRLVVINLIPYFNNNNDNKFIEIYTTYLVPFIDIWTRLAKDNITKGVCNIFHHSDTNREIVDDDGNIYVEGIVFNNNGRNVPTSASIPADKNDANNIIHNACQGTHIRPLDIGEDDKVIYETPKQTVCTSLFTVGGQDNFGSQTLFGLEFPYHLNIINPSEVMMIGNTDIFMPIVYSSTTVKNIINMSYQMVSLATPYVFGTITSQSIEGICKINTDRGNDYHLYRQASPMAIDNRITNIIIKRKPTPLTIIKDTNDKDKNIFLPFCPNNMNIPISCTPLPGSTKATLEYYIPGIRNYILIDENSLNPSYAVNKIFKDIDISDLNDNDDSILNFNIVLNA